MGVDPFGLVGKVLGSKYEIREQVGEGGFSVVYSGFHRHLAQPVAVKVLKIPPEFEPAARAKFVEQFTSEGRILSNLADHPAIVRVLDFGTSEQPGDALFYLVLEWLAGRDLESILASNRVAFSERDAIELLLPVVEALALAHQQGIVHRDLKPANIFLAETKLGVRPKLLDFGIAKAFQEGELLARRTTHTSSGFRAFTPAYGAPEQFRPKRHGATGPYTDVHALGLILVELVSGRAALEGEEEADFLIQSTGFERPTPRARGASVSDAFEALCRTALALEPQDRFHDAEQLRQALSALLEPNAPAPTTTPGRSGDTLVVPLRPWMATAVLTPARDQQPPRPEGHQPPTFLAARPAMAAGAPPSSGETTTMPTTAGTAPRPTTRFRRTSTLTLVTGTGLLGLGVALWLAQRPHQAVSPAPSGAPTVTTAPVIRASSTPSPHQAAGPSAAVDAAQLPEAIAIPAGKFSMGSNAGDTDEQPVHTVNVKGFMMDRTEVTVAAYLRCFHAGPCSAPRTGPNCNFGQPDRADHPINCVDARQAEVFCGWHKKRLPTEQEWEYAAVGTDDRLFPWGDAPPEDERLCWAKRDGTCRVATHPAGASPFGVLDLAGNVSEWTASRYCDSYGKHANCTSGRVYRGASFIELRPEVARSAYRDERDPTQHSPYVGFRCVK